MGVCCRSFSTATGKASLAFADFSSTKVDRRRVLELLEDLESPDKEKVSDAFQKLSTMGTGSWPLLEKELDLHPPAVRDKIAVLLKNRTDPTLGEMVLVDSELRVAARSSDGGVLLYSKGGVSVINADGDQNLVYPAWISVRPGQPIRLMPGSVWGELTPGTKRFYGVSGGEWIMSDDGVGPQEAVGTFLMDPILHKSEIKYNELVGTDRRGRWLFREPMHADGTRSTATLVIDPTLPPVVPRLPVWAFKNAGKVGCDQHGWAAYEDRGSNIWLITENGFELMEKKTDAFVSAAEELSKMKLPRDHSSEHARCHDTSLHHGV